MNTLASHRELVCGPCGQKITKTELLLLREDCALPEEPTFYVHGSCVDTFIEEHPGRWKKITSDSIEAGWLLY